MFPLTIRTRLARLHSSLESLGRQLRESIAGIVARTTADAVRDAVRSLLEDKDRSTSPIAHPARPPDRPTSLWGDADDNPRSSWDADDEDLDDHGDLLPTDDPFEDTPTTRTQLPRKPREVPLPKALIAGCQATAWWLKRHPGRYSLLAALGVGLAAGVTAFVSSSIMVGGASVVVSALGLVVLADTAHSVAGALAGR